jgi:hypothetical protein
LIDWDIWERKDPADNILGTLVAISLAISDITAIHLQL